MVRQEELDLPEAIRVPPSEADEERDRPGSCREARRLRVEADERSRRWWLARQATKPFTVQRKDERRGLAADHRTRRVEHDLTVERGCEALGEGDRAATRPGRNAIDGLRRHRLVAGRSRPQRGAVVREPPLERRA